jgi:hypothetical protein
MEEEKIMQYVLNGGRLFHIVEIESMRDSGTKRIRCSNGDTFYITKDTNEFFLDYNDKRIIKDENLISYLMERVRTYVQRSREQCERSEKLFIKLTEKYIAG